ncbi:MAG: cytochrome C oxidase Cbb3 [Myxococcales bacterium]|nr:cytochrome C oxidase Cbb3 [Myxococcales bacterium]|tara:strand:- start:392 stop:649 length:258 start_codon:yes stop_codon:yes gene_type:complete
MNCAVCHGPQGRTNPQKFTPAPRKFGGMGLKMGFFFGGDKMRAGIFQKIKTGQSAKSKVPSQMAGFGDLLHNEQIWALVLHLENL